MIKDDILFTDLKSLIIAKSGESSSDPEEQERIQEARTFLNSLEGNTPDIPRLMLEKGAGMRIAVCSHGMIGAGLAEKIMSIDDTVKVIVIDSVRSGIEERRKDEVFAQHLILDEELPMPIKNFKLEAYDLSTGIYAKPVHEPKPWETRGASKPWKTKHHRQSKKKRRR